MDSNKISKSEIVQSTGARPIDVDAERVRFLYRSSTTANLANIGIGSLATWAMWDRVSHTHLLTWFIVLCVVIAGRALAVARFKQHPPSDHEIQKWLYPFAILTTMAGLTWGMSIWVLAPFADPYTPILITFTLGGMTAGGAAILGSVITVYFIYTLSVMLPITTWYFLQGSTSHLIMGYMLIVYILAMLAGGYIYRKVLLRSIVLTNELAMAKEEADIANQAKSQFLSSMSHELRTPLNAILGYAQIIQMDNQDSEQTQENVAEIMKGGQHLLNLIDGLLDLGKIESREVVMQIESLDINELLEECITLVKPLTEHYSVSVQFDGQDSQKIRVLADRMKLKQVILNLLSNACKYNHPGGEVAVDCTTSGNAQASISIRNTGEGLSEAEQKKLFQPFQRLGQENSAIEGTGLGLTIVKQLVELMRGSIRFNSDKKEGTTFMVSLPTG